MRFLWIILINSVHLVLGSQVYHKNKYKEDKNAKELPTRLLRLMRSYYEDANQRVTELNHHRFMYEESPHYETGYLMHEIIERYKKMVEHMHRMVDFKSNVLFDNIERTEQVQKLYFEIYHLVNMVHEIPRKWKNTGEFAEKKKVLVTSTEQDAMKKANEKNKKERKERMRIMKKRRELFMEGQLMTEKPKTGAKRIPYNPHWPLDYGWEIDKWD